MTAQYTPAAKSSAAEKAALGRISAPEEQAAAAIWLLSDDSSFVTGETINTNGGLAFG
jgi:3-oxoacyl-[acyl-carrier protein] reductase